MLLTDSLHYKSQELSQVYLTCNIGGYDDLKSDPKYPTILFTTEKEIDTYARYKNVYVVSLPELQFDNVVLSRWVKTFGLALTSQYFEVVVYHDYNIIIKNDILPLMQTGLNIRKHPENLYVIDELRACAETGKLNLNDLRYIKQLKLENTVYECNIVGIKNYKNIIQPLSRWFNLFRTGVRRDQLHFAEAFSGAQNQLNLFDLGDIRSKENEFVRYDSHDDNLGTIRKINRKLMPKLIEYYVK